MCICWYWYSFKNNVTLILWEFHIMCFDHIHLSLPIPPWSSSTSLPTQLYSLSLSPLFLLTKSTLYWSTTPGHGVCSEVWSIYHVSHHWRPLPPQHWSNGKSSLATGRISCLPSLLHASISSGFILCRSYARCHNHCDYFSTLVVHA